MRWGGHRTIILGAAALAICGSCWTSTVFAQDSSIEEIVVTATKRAQSVQDVPIAVSAYGEELLFNTGVDDIKELMNVSPSFQASSNVSSTQGLVIRIRGIGTQGNNPAFESAVGVFIDGVYRARAGIALSEMLDIERIEVLRGPQGTLFGRNTSAGAISVITKAPSFEPEAYGQASFGNFDEFDVRGSFTAPLIEDKLAVRVAAQFARRDGFIRDILTGEQLDNKDRYSVKGQLLFTPTDSTSIRLIFDGREANESCCFPVTIKNGVAASIINGLLVPGTQINPPAPFNRRATKTPDRPATQNVNDWGVSNEIKIEGENLSFTSVTSYRQFESFRELDLDFTDADLINQTRLDTNNIFTQELRLQGVWGNLDWMVGAFFSDENIKLGSTTTHGRQYEDFINARLGPLLGAFFGTDYSGLAFALSGGQILPGSGWRDGTGAIGDQFRSDNQAYSLFAHNVYTLTEGLEAIIGARLNIDNKHAVSNLDNNPTNTPGCTAILPAIKAVPNFTFNDLGIIPGDLRRIKDVMAALGCLGIASPAFNYDLEQNVAEWSGIFGLSYTVSDDMLVYGHFSRGYKAGGINLDRAGTILTLVGDNSDPNNFLDPRFLPETVDSFELGFKANSVDNRLRLNIALFWENFDNFQLNTFTGFNFTPENVEKAKTRGVEVEFAAVPTDGLQFQGGVTYSKADYGNSITDLTNRLANERGFRVGTSPLPLASPLAGRQLTNAPRWVVTSSLTYGAPVGSSRFEAFIHGDLRYSSTFNTGSDLDAEKQQGAFTVVNMRGGIRAEDGSWQIDLFAKNVFDVNYNQVAFDIPLQANDGFGSFIADPRTWGISLRGNF